MEGNSNEAAEWKSGINCRVNCKYVLSNYWSSIDILWKENLYGEVLWYLDLIFQCSLKIKL